MTDAPTPPFGTPGGRPGEDATQAFPTQPPVGYPTHPPAGYPVYPPGGYPPPPPGAGHGPAPAPRGGKGPVIGLIVALVVLALVVAGVGIVLLTRGDDDVANRSSPTTEAPDETTAPDGTTTQTTGADTTDTTTDDAVDRVVGEWSGAYTCAQGLTVLDLTIEAGAGADAVTAVFAFSPDPSNPDVPDGSFAMSGTATEGGGLALEPGEWIDRPGTFQTVGLAAPLPAAPDRLVGTIEDSPGCTTFDLTRTG